MSIQITAELVKELRDRTGVSIMQCKNALEEVGGDMEKALIVLKKKSSSIALKKADRDAHEGIIVVIEGKEKVLLLTLNCETDFVAKNDDFINLANQLAKIAAEKGVEAMKTESTDIINPIIQKVGEKIEVGMIEEITGTTLGSYVHNNKAAVVVSLTGGTSQLAKDVAMHIAAMRPAYTTREEITEEEKAKVTEVFEREVSESDKPEDIKKKMLEGKLLTYFKEQTLLDQPFIKDPSKTIEALLKENGATLVKFVRESIA